LGWELRRWQYRVERGELDERYVDGLRSGDRGLEREPIREATSTQDHDMEKEGGDERTTHQSVIHRTWRLLVLRTRH
jgi:hypothetical protein